MAQANVESSVERDASGRIVVTAWLGKRRGHLILQDNVVAVAGDFNDNPFSVELLPLLACAAQVLAEQTEAQDAIRLAMFLGPPDMPNGDD